MVLRKTIKNLLLFLIKTVTFLFTWCMHIQNNYITSATFQNYIWHPIAKKNSTLLTA